MFFEAKEFVRHSPGEHPLFYRAIRCMDSFQDSKEALIITRWGKVCSLGTSRVTYLSRHASFKRFQALSLDAYNRGYHEVRYDRTKEPVELPSPLTPAAVESVFTTRWRDYAAPAPLDHANMAWSIRSGILQMAPTDQRAAFVLELAKTLPHAIDETRDLIIMPRSREKGPLALADVPFSPDHTPELLQAVLALYSPELPGLRDVFSAAAILAAH